MQSVHWQNVRRLFEAALDLDTAARSRFLAAECGADAALRSEVEELLAADETEEGRSSILDAEPSSVLSKRCASLVGREVDGFRIVRLLGSGGMGAVYAAEQDHPRRKVALKVMRHGLQSEASLRRFRYESEILGRLQHTGIAQVYAAGTHVDGDVSVPYFAMELIDGRELQDYVITRGLDRRGRLELFARICAAVHYGHVRGVIHRDLKPANILVDEAGAPKVIDFGIARCTDSDFDGVTLKTQAGLLLGTLQYMSPEQVRGRRDAVDATSDVYSLGVILFQLLTGALPHDLRNRTIPDAIRVISETDPVSADDIDRSLRGDLTTIVKKAMAAVPELRYSSAAELAADVEAFLTDQPIRARPPSTFYHIRKFARRNTALLVAVVLFIALLLAGVFVVGWQNVTIQREAQRAAAEGEKARAVSQFVRGILSEAQAITGHGPDYTVRQALDAAAGRIGAELAGQPEIELEVRDVVGSTYLQLSVFGSAEEHLVRALELAETLDNPTALMRAQLALARLRRNQDRLGEAARLSARAGGLGAAKFGTDDLPTLAARHDQACHLAEQHRYSDAETILRDVLARRAAQLGPDAPDTLATRYRLGLVQLFGGAHEEGARRLEQVLAARERVLGKDHLDTVRSRVAWGHVLRVRGDLAGAVDRYSAAAEALRKRLGPDHRWTLDATFYRIWVMSQQGQFGKVQKLAAETLKRCQRVLGEMHQHTQTLMRAEAGARMQRGELSGALQLFRRAYDLSMQAKGKAHRDTQQAGSDLAFALRTSGAHDQCLALLEELRTVPGGLKGRMLCQYEMVRGLCRLDQRQFEPAEASLEAALALAQSGSGRSGYDARAIVKLLCVLYEAWGKKGLAGRYRAELGRIDAVRNASSTRNK